MVSRLSMNSLWLLISRVGTQLGFALFTILLARGLGSAVFGEYAFMASIIVVGNVLTTFGTDMLLIREIAATDDLSHLSAALWIQLVLSLLFIGAVFVTLPYLPAQDTVPVAAVRMYSLSMLPLAFYTVFTTALRGRQHMQAYSALNLMLMLLQLLAALWLLWKHGDLLLLATLLLMVQVVAAGLAGILCTVRLRDFGRARAFSIHDLLPLMRASAPIALLGLLGVVYQRFSLLALPSLAGALATGWFSAAARLVEAAKIGHLAVFTAIYPMMAQARRADEAAWSRNFRLPALALLTGALLASILLNFFARFVVTLLFGPQYLPAVPLVQVLSWILIPYALNSFLTLALLARGEERSIAVALALSMCLLVALTLWWVPVAGAVGAVSAAVCAEVAQAICLVLADLRRPHVLKSLLGSVSVP